MAWEQMISILNEAREIDAAEASTPPESCPNDYTALKSGPDGILFCPWDGWQYPRDA